MRRALPALAACVLAAPLAAQGWSAEATVGRAAYDPVAARVSSTSASLALRYDTPRRWLYASAGSPVDGAGPGWAATGLGGFLGVAQRKGLTLGATVAGHAYGYVDADVAPTGGGGTVEVLPTVTFERGPVRAQLSSGFVGVADGVSGLYSERRGFLDTNAGVAWTPSKGVELSAGARYLHGEGRQLPYAGGGAQLERDWGGAWAYAGAWLAPGYARPATAAGLGASLRLRGRVELSGAFRQEPADPLYSSIPRRSWSVSVRRGFGRRPASARPAAPLPVVAGDGVTFRLPRAEGDSVAPAVLGDFTRWEPVPMAADGEFWTVTVRIPRGVHHYGFRKADGTFVVPPGLPLV
ncbi:MAG TPA: glycogen-binding domain-containing protein, partial [Longimicrobium sp.]|nr:glycogen-binding domain-containing protein [Longimicrobium sp.]